MRKLHIIQQMHCATIPVRVWLFRHKRDDFKQCAGRKSFIIRLLIRPAQPHSGGGGGCIFGCTGWCCGVRCNSFAQREGAWHPVRGCSLQSFWPDPFPLLCAV